MLTIKNKVTSINFKNYLDKIYRNYLECINRFRQTSEKINAIDCK